ncbi:MAG: class I SAM-dependent methyltransferase [Deltaproteobacteria bacterium]|nr:class I SAM-dependent methyltransferase [Deltaproteobacteria bacterium]
MEVDHPATQSAKRERMAKADLSEPENLIFRPADFEHETLDEVLARGTILDLAATSLSGCPLDLIKLSDVERECVPQTR